MSKTTAVVMPQLGLEVTEGRITALLVAAGATVSAEQPVAEAETDKAMADIVAPCAGIVQGIDVEVGDIVPVGSVVLRLATPEASPVVLPPPPPASSEPGVPCVRAAPA